MVEKCKFDIEIENSDKICGGYLMTTKPMTIRQVEDYMVRLGKDLLRNNKNLNSVSYWATEETEGEVYKSTWVTVNKYGRRFSVLINSLIGKKEIA